MIVYIDKNFNMRKSDIVGFLNLDKFERYMKIKYSEESKGFVIEENNELIEFEEEDLENFKRFIRECSDPRPIILISKKLLIN